LVQTVEEYAEWENSLNPEKAEEILSGLQGTIKKVGELTQDKIPFEEALVVFLILPAQQISNAEANWTKMKKASSGEGSTLDAYLSYLNHEMTSSNMNTFSVRTLFERAIKENCLIPDLWIKYTGFLVDFLYSSHSFS